MKNKSNNTPETPLSVNIIRLQSYKLPPDEAIFFDWLVVKSISFGYKKFHYSQARIEKETRIKRTRQDSIIRKFCNDLMFLGSAVQEHEYSRGRVRYFLVDFWVLSDKDTLSEIIDIKSGLFKNFISFFKHHASIQKKAGKEKESKKIESLSDSDNIYNSLNEVYDSRREMYNNGEITGEKPARLKSQTQIQRNKIINKKLIKLAETYDLNAIKHSFAAYIDAVFKEKETPENMMYLFLTFDDVKGSFPVFDKYLNIFNLNYGYSIE